MRGGKEGFLHLAFCTNVHPSDGWAEVFSNLRRFPPALRERLAPEEPFGIGLRLSGVESRELLEESRLERFRSFLDDHGLYVFTLNGFPYGTFHGQPAKANVHAPDWREEERVRYTLRLAEILAYLLPEEADGGISTSPLSYKAWVNAKDPTIWEHLVRQLVRVVEELVRIRREQGKTVHVDIEPEPDGLLENSAEVVRFYERWLLGTGARVLAARLGTSLDEARSLVLDHVRICFDTCHVAMACEDPEQVLDRFARTGIKVGKVQISSALKVPLPEDEAGRVELEGRLRPFAESTYLHQVACLGRDGTLRRYPDLADALPYLRGSEAVQWRIHFHVPVFVERYGALLPTQQEIRRTFELLRERRFCRHLEIETYTWSVLPEGLKEDLLELICREYEWVLDGLRG